MKSRKRKTLGEQISNYRVSATGCWEWQGSLNRQGYGQVMITTEFRKARPFGVHRLSYEQYRGPIPAGMVVMHKCDNRKCLNPDHLTIGTQADNLADCRAKGRWASGWTKQWVDPAPPPPPPPGLDGPKLAIWLKKGPTP